MSAENGSPILAVIGIPTIAQCLTILAPILGVLGLYWVTRNADWIIDTLFPEWDWEKRLGWINFRVTRRADALWRWLSYAVYALLACALYGITWGATAFADLDLWTPQSVADGMGKLVVLILSLGLFFLYFGCELIPKLRRQYEKEALDQYRANHPEPEDDPSSPEASSQPRHPVKIDIWSRSPPPSSRH